MSNTISFENWEDFDPTTAVKLLLYGQLTLPGNYGDSPQITMALGQYPETILRTVCRFSRLDQLPDPPVPTQLLHENLAQFCAEFQQAIMAIYDGRFRELR